MSTSPPDWLVERAALDEVAPQSRARVDAADPAELAERIAAIRADNATELAAYPAGPALEQINARVASEAARRRARRRLTMVGMVGVASVAAVAAVVLVAGRVATGDPTQDVPEVTRVKGATRLLAFRHVGDHAEPLAEDDLVREGDLIQLRYNAGGRKFGVIASVDGAGEVTLHYPGAEDAPPEDTALSTKPTPLAHAYALDNAPRFERFFFITADDPIELAPCLGALRSLAERGDAASASLDLPSHLHQWSLRLRKPTP
ncbi:MAG: hypothetical protein AB7T06_14155 [Kofleriaceae bacterium]